MKKIKGWENLYYITRDGKVWSPKKGTSNPKGKFIKQSFDHNGYWRVSFKKDKKTYNYSVHRLIAEAYIPNPKNFPQVNHKNGIKADNRIENLEWCTEKENTVHAEINGLRKHNDWGGNNTRAKITNEQASEVKTLAIKGEMLQKDIGKMFNISQEMVSRIKRGRNYARL